MDPISVVQTCLADLGWEPADVPAPSGQRAWQVVLSTDAGLVQGIAHLEQTISRFTFYVLPGVKVPLARRAAVAELAARVGFGLRVAAIELNMDDGVVRFRAGVDFRDAPFEPRHVRNTISAAAHTAQRHLEALRAVIGGASAVDALRSR